jgi:hypothetical protein
MASLRIASLGGSRGEGDTLGLREGSVKGFLDWSVWIEEGFFHHWASKAFEVFLCFLDGSSLN